MGRIQKIRMLRVTPHQPRQNVIYIQLFDYPIILVKWIFNNYNKAKVRDTCRLKQPYSSEIWRRYEYRKETIEKLKVAS